MTGIGGAGGFGGGGGAGPIAGGLGGFGGGTGAIDGGGGGAAFGGGIFVRHGGSLVIRDNGTISGGSVTGGQGFGSGGNGSAFASGLFLHGSGTLAFDAAAGTTFSVLDQIADLQAVGGAGVWSVSKLGAGTLALETANAYSGGTALTLGTLVLGHSAAAGTGQISVSNAKISYADGIDISNSLALAAGTVKLNVAAGESAKQSGVVSQTPGFGVLEKAGAGELILSASNTYSGPTRISEGTIGVQGGAALPDGAELEIGLNGALNLLSSETIGRLSGEGDVSLNTWTLTTGDNTDSNFDGCISGANGNLIKQGTGKFSVACLTHGGLATVSAGELQIAGVVGGSISVADGAVLSGTAAITGDVANHGTVSPGRSAGSLSVSGNWTESGALTMDVDFARASAPILGVTHDYLRIGGDVLDVTTIQLSNIGSGTALPTNGAGILIVDVEGRVDPTSFVLSGGSFETGGITYRLRHVSNYSGLMDGFFLVCGCQVGLGNDVCKIDAATDQSIPIDALAGMDTLQVGGLGDFVFEVDRVGTSYSNFEIFQKIDGNAVTLGKQAKSRADWRVDAGNLIASGGDAIFDTSAVAIASGATLALSASEQIGNLSGAGALSLGANTLTTGDALNTSFTGTTSGAGGLTKVGTGRFATGALAHTGLTSVNGGELNTNGAIAGSVTVNAGATLSGNFTIAGTLTGAGGRISVGNSPGSATVASLAGVSTQTVEVVFNSVNAPVNGTTHDFLNITGAASGTHTLTIVPFAPSTAPVATAGNGVELVRIGGANSATFALSAPVVQGGFEYVLKTLADYSGTTDGVFLQSGVRQEIAAISGAQMASAALNASCGSAESRIGAATNSRRHGWATADTSSLETGADTGLISDADTTCVNTGMTFASGLPNLNLGFSLSMGSYDGTLSLVGGAATLEGTRFGAEAILSYAKGMFFATAAAGLASQDFEFQGSSFSNTGRASGLTANLAAGVHLPLASIAELTLAGVFDYNDAVCRDVCFGFASYAEGDAIMTGTVRASAKAQFDALSPYGALSYSTVFSNDPDAILGAPVASFIGDTTMTATLGIDIKIFEAAQIFVEGRYMDAMNKDANSQSIMLGLRASW